MIKKLEKEGGQNPIDTQNLTVKFIMGLIYIILKKFIKS